MADECRELTKLAKGMEKESPNDAVELYKQAAQCFGSSNKPKDCNSNLTRAAKLLRETAKSNDDPIKALIDYKQSSVIYHEIGKVIDAGKVMQEAHQKFIRVAKVIRSEGKKLDDIYLADQKFRLASNYALQGKDELLSYQCWIDSGDKFREFANNIQDPKEASEFYKQAILNYRKGHTYDGEFATLTDQAEKFSKNAENLYKKRKDLVFAFDNYLHAATIYSQINSKEKALVNARRVGDIVETIGIPKDSLIEYLIRQEVKPNSIFNPSLSNRNIVPQDLIINKIASNEFTNAEGVKPPIIKNLNQNSSNSTFEKKTISKLLGENNFDTEFSKAIKERRRAELRQNINNPPLSNIKENKTSLEIENLFEVTLDEPIEEILADSSDYYIHEREIAYSTIADPIVDEEVIAKLEIIDPVIENEIEDKPEMSFPIIEFLKNQGYISTNLTREKDLLQIPEYQILSIIIKHHPITLDQIEDITELGSISLVLSNLQADELIV